MTWHFENLTNLANEQAGWITERDADCLTISNEEGIDIFAFTGTSQLVFESILFPADAVTDESALNSLILETHQLLPLSTIGTRDIDGERYYVAFGSLSVESKTEVVVEEIEALFDNVPEFLELYSEHLAKELAA